MVLRVALLITTFNRSNALNLVLESVAAQTHLPDQVIICDDGSDIETGIVIDNWADKLTIIHTWQPNSNFRAARSRNIGALKSNTEYLVWIDGDCLVPPQFIENHLALARRGYLVSGGRHLLPHSVTEAHLLGYSPTQTAFKNWKFWFLPFNWLRDLGSKSWASVRTCNVGLYRDDLSAVGGFDESYIGWGREDSDFVVRLVNRGIRIRSGRLAVCVAHLHHVENCREQLSINEERFQDLLVNSLRIFAKKTVFLE